MADLRFLFLLQLPFLLLSTAYQLPDKFFINCGSDSTTTVNGRSFVGDLNSASFSPGNSEVVKIANSSTVVPPLYQTARVYRRVSAYELDIAESGVYFVRLHFYGFSSSNIDLVDGLFNVSASGFSFLSNFRVDGSESTSPVIKEFLLTIDVGKFVIYFVPSGNTSFAFVNAIEVFITPEEFLADDVTSVPPVGSNGSYGGLPSQVLHTVNRINVGGARITPDNDTLWRTWTPDDSFLYFGDFVKNASTNQIFYQPGAATKYDAPDYVYKTAKELNIDNSSESNSSIITWRFAVNKNGRHLVRVHICDFISISFGTLRFNFYIYSNFSKTIFPYEINNLVSAPIYLEFVVDSDNSGYMNISIGSSPESSNKEGLLNGLEIFELMASSPVPTLPKTNKSNLVVILGSVGGAAVVLVVVILLGLKVWKRKPVKTLANGDGGSYERSSEKTGSGTPVNLNFRLKMPLDEILEATHNFDPKLLIGEGGFGKVYKGILRSGIKVAVKRSDSKHNQGLPEFQTEILVLSRIRHRHLVSLIGYCDERSEMILVYEYMENGTLREHLYGSNKRERTTLSWKRRVEICIGSAKGLHYLHSGLDWGVIHRDVKSTNILLDEAFVAKVADFGLSKSGPDSEEVTMAVKGTFGYLDPEYFRCLQLTEKSDVYSFGVLLLEVLCARPAILNSAPREEVNLAEWGMLWQKRGQLEKIIDPFLVGEINPSSLRKFGEVADKCLSDIGAERPTMGDVLWDLEYALKLQETAVHREPHEDSAVDASMELQLPGFVSFPSNSFMLEDDYVGRGGNDDSGRTASQVFSQLKMNEAR